MNAKHVSHSACPNRITSQFLTHNFNNYHTNHYCIDNIGGGKHSGPSSDNVDNEVQRLIIQKV
eukprot:m.355992 g.355992  ORF g.355992 m.355992 type:complete len:63 (-) comp20741_c0_seq6:6-194(-)